VVADIPGLIEGAHTGTGLGAQFLRHIERTRVLAHIVDVSDASGRPDPVQDFKVIMNELTSFGAGLEAKPMVVAASKMDVVNKEKLAQLRKHCKKLKLDLYEISAVAGQGIPELKYGLGRLVAAIRAGKYAQPTIRKKAARKVRKAKPQSVRVPKRAAFKKRKSQ